jgi:uncharacterized linocin/CFP29 family protein
MSDFIMNGSGHGSVASTLMANNFDPHALRPYLGSDGNSYVTVNQGGNAKSFVTNAPATLRKDDWIQLDEAVVQAAKQRLRAVADLRSAGLQFSLPNGMSKTVLQYENESDISGATVSMDGLRESDSDRPEYNLVNLPLPIIHKDFSFSARQVMASRNGGSALDTTMAELAGRKVAEEAENLLLGVSSSYAYGGGTIYGYTNFPSRLTKTMTAPSSSNHATTVQEILAMKTQSQDATHFGPWFCYCSTSWDAYMDEDYSSSKGDNTLRDRIGNIEGVDRPSTLDFLPANTLVLVQKTADVARMVVGMDVTTVQWETKGGMELNFKVMAILVPQLRADFNSNTGIVHGTHA